MNEIVNPLTILGARVVDFPPPHFEYVVLDYMDTHVNIKNIIKWISQNLKFRYFIGEILEITNGNVQTNFKVGFEYKSEMTFFLLACPYLHK